MRTFSGGGGSYRPTSANSDIERRAIPTSLELVTSENFLLFYLEAANNSGGDVVVTVYDQTGMVLVPASQVANGNILTYRSDFGTPMDGLSWIASGPGLVGWFCGALL